MLTLQRYQLFTYPKILHAYDASLVILYFKFVRYDFIEVNQTSWLCVPIAHFRPWVVRRAI